MFFHVWSIHLEWDSTLQLIAVAVRIWKLATLCMASWLSMVLPESLFRRCQVNCATRTWTSTEFLRSVVQSWTIWKPLVLPWVQVPVCYTSHGNALSDKKGVKGEATCPQSTNLLLGTKRMLLSWTMKRTEVEIDWGTVCELADYLSRPPVHRQTNQHCWDLQWPVGFCPQGRQFCQEQITYPAHRRFWTLGCNTASYSQVNYNHPILTSHLGKRQFLLTST